MRSPSSSCGPTMPVEPAPVAEMAESGRRRRPVLDLGWDWPVIAAAGLLLQGYWLWRLRAPSYMDAFYYATNGQRLAEGFGFTELVVWQFFDDLPGLPVPSHTYWQPLPSVLAAAGRSLLPTFTGSQLLFWLLAGLLPLLAYSITRIMRGARWQAWTAALFTATGGYYSAYFSQPSTFAPFAWLGGGCMLLLGLASSDVWSNDERDAGRYRRLFMWALAGLMAGYAHLTRADGVLLLLVGVIIWAHGFRSPSSGHRRVDFRDLGWFFTGYVAVMGVWFLRNWAVFGRPVSSAGLQSLFLTGYDDLFAYGRVHTLQSYLEWGWDNIVLSKLDALQLGLQTYLGVVCLIFLAPFVVVGWWSFWRRPVEKQLLKPVTCYAFVLVLVMPLLFTFPSTRGSLFHSSVALWPWSMSLAAAGLGSTVDWVAGRLPHWEPEKAKPRFAALFFVVGLVISLAVARTEPLAGENPAIWRQMLDQLPESAVVMVGNAPAFHYYTGLPAVSVPNEPLETLLQAAAQYGVSHLVLNENRPAPLAGLYEQASQDPRLPLLAIVDGVQLYEVLTDEP
jgi:hypothetical protein